LIDFARLAQAGVEVASEANSRAVAATRIVNLSELGKFGIVLSEADLAR
jgi:hypothetical protein